MTSYVAPDLPEILGLLENVVYSSPDSGVHGDFSLALFKLQCTLPPQGTPLNRSDHNDI